VYVTSVDSKLEIEQGGKEPSGAFQKGIARLFDRSKRMWGFVFATLMVPWLIGASLMVVLLPAVTHFWTSRYIDASYSSYSLSELIEIGDEGLAYVTGRADNLPRGNSYKTSFDEAAVSHLDDVRAVFNTARLITMIISVALALLVFIYARSGNTAVLGDFLGGSAVLTAGLIMLLVLLGWLNFDKLFTAMHKLLFVDDSWLFPYDSLLLTVYPQQFWIAMAATWAVVLFICCLSTKVLGNYLSRQTR